METKQTLFSYLVWIYYFHSEKLATSLELLAKHGRFQELTWLVYYLLWIKTDEDTRKTMSMKEEAFDFENVSLEKVIWACVDVKESRPLWLQYLRSLPDDASRRAAKEMRQSLTKEIQTHRSKEKEIKNKAISARIAEMEKDERFTSVFETVVDIFVSGIKLILIPINCLFNCLFHYHFSSETLRRCFKEGRKAGCDSTCCSMGSRYW